MLPAPDVPPDGSGQVLRFADRRSVLPGGKGSDYRIFCHPQRAVAGINIFIGNQVIHGAGQTNHFINRLIEAIVSCTLAKASPDLLMVSWAFCG